MQVDFRLPEISSDVKTFLCELWIAVFMRPPMTLCANEHRIRQRDFAALAPMHLLMHMRRVFNDWGSAQLAESF